MTRHGLPTRRDILRLLDAAIFNAVIGNADAHGKNFSLIYRAEGVAFAPLYDLMVTALYPEVATRSAMPIGRANQIEHLDAKAWARFASDMGLGGPFVRRRVEALALDIAVRAPAVSESLAETGGDPNILDALVTIVEGRAALIRSAL